jgi:HNH endonuclease
MKQGSLERFKIYSIDFVLSQCYIPKDYKHEDKIYKKLSRKEIDGKIATFYSHRLITFKNKGIQCCKCGIEGKYFALEKFPADLNIYHFNLYAVNDEGEEILMTKDHIIPISKGGLDIFENYQTMCSKCNVEKGNKL